MAWGWQQDGPRGRQRLSRLGKILGGMLGAIAVTIPGLAPGAIAQTALCPEPVLSRLSRHRVAPGESLEVIAQRYSLLPATIMGLNPATQGGGVTPGQELLIPPYNGIRVAVAPGQTWEQVARAYNSRADVLFEVNGCVSTVPSAVFVPGVNWFPGVSTTASGAAPTPSSSPLQGYPLARRSQIVVNYGWQPDAAQGKLVFNTGVAIASDPGTAVLAVGPGTVAFAGSDSTYGNLVVVNHAQGLQTRYANLAGLNVRAGQAVRQGDRLGTVAPAAGNAAGNAADSPTAGNLAADNPAAGNPAAGNDSFLFFEVRLNSTMGWVAQDPQDYVPTLALR